MSTGISRVFSPNLEKIPKNYVSPDGNTSVGDHFRDNPGMVARLLLECYVGSRNRVQNAARLARRTLEMLEFQMQNLNSDNFVDAAASGQISHVKKMMAAGQAIDAIHSLTGYAALHAACDFGHMDIVKLLCEAGADLYVTSKKEGSIPLHHAAGNGHIDIVKYLVFERECTKLWRNKFDMTPYDYAKESSYELLMKILQSPPERIVVVEATKSNSRSVDLIWDIPKDNGVEIDRFHIVTKPIAGMEYEVFPESAKKESLYVVLMDDCTRFSENHKEEKITEEKADSITANKVRYMLSNVLMPSTTYSISVRAVTLAGNGALSDAIQYTTPCDVPSPPGMVKVIPEGICSSTVDVCWQAPVTDNGSPVEDYELQQRAIGTSVWTTQEIRVSASSKIPASLSLSPGEYRGMVFGTLTDLTPRTKYEIRVRGINGLGLGEFSPILGVPVRTKALVEPVCISREHIEITWPQPDADSGFSSNDIKRWVVSYTNPPGMGVLEYDWHSTDWTTLPDTVLGHENHFTCRELLPSTLYYIRVEAKMKSPTQPDETFAVSCGIRTSQSVPETPKQPFLRGDDLYDCSKSPIQHRSVMLSWYAPFDFGQRITHYTVRYTTRDSGVWTTPMSGTFEVKLFDDPIQFKNMSDLDPGTEYRFAVRAKNQTGWSDFSEASDWILTRPCAPPNPPNPTFHTAEMISLEWEFNRAFPAEQYRVQYRQVFKAPDADDDAQTRCGEWQFADSGEDLLEPLMDVHGLQPVSFYEFRVQAYITEMGSWTNFSSPSRRSRTSRRL